MSTLSSHAFATPRTGAVSGSHEHLTEASVTLINDDVEVEILPGRGGSIKHLSLGGVGVLTPYRDPSGSDSRYHTSHPMLPFSRENPYMPIHGGLRFTNHSIVEAASGHLVMEAADPWSDMPHRREVRLLSDGVEVVSIVCVPEDDETQHLSYGDHLYLPLEQPDQAQLIDGANFNANITVTRPNGEIITGTLAELLARQDIQGDDDEAETYQLQTSGNLTLALPGVAISIQVAAFIDSGEGTTAIEVPTRFFLWHARGSGTFCIEPVAGAWLNRGDTLTTDGLTLHPDRRLVFVTNISKAQL